MDRSLKERLIGAAVLVALAVWLIPWVLNGPEPAAEAESEALELPAAESTSTVRTQTIRLDENRDPPTPAAREETVTVPTPAPRSETVAAPTPEPPESPVQAIETSQPEQPPQAASASEEPDPPEEPPAPPAGDEPTVTSEGEAWMVQIGSFSEEDNAQRLVQRVATFGFNARVSTFNASAGPMYRVRVGPESSRDRAVAVASSLSAHGFVAQVVSQD